MSMRAPTWTPTPQPIFASQLLWLAVMWVATYGTIDTVGPPIQDATNVTEGMSEKITLPSALAEISGSMRLTPQFRDVTPSHWPSL